MNPTRRKLTKAEKMKAGPPPVSKYAAKRRPYLVEEKPEANDPA